MKKIILFPFILFCLSAFSQNFNINNYRQNFYTISFTRKSGANPFYVEVPPCVVKGGWYQYFFTTSFSGAWSSMWSMNSLQSENMQVGNSAGYGPLWVLAASNWWGYFYDPKYLESSSYEYSQQWKTYHWRRNYNGVFGAHALTLPSGQNILFAVSHGENKNEKQDNFYYQNTVRPSFLINTNDPATYSGVNNGVYVDCWDAYFGFVNGNWLPYDSAHDWGNQYLNDLGPIAWPSAGYVNPDGTQASSGLRHPSSIVYNNYIYSYVKDESKDGTGGIKLIRCSVANILNPASYETWSETRGWISSLPNGFSKEQCANYFSVRGPQNSPVFPAERNTIRFSVARFRNSGLFIGVEQYNDDFDKGRCKLAFRTSSDLIHWSGRINFYSNKTLDWDDFQFKYPIFLNTEGTSNNDIDINSFFVIGTSTDNKVNKLYFQKFRDFDDDKLLLEGSKSANDLHQVDVALKLAIGPNPVKDRININLQPASGGLYNLVIFNSSGMLLKTTSAEIKNGGSYVDQISFASYPAGSYFVVLSKDGNVMQTVRLVK
jgi:hypothetical protein